MKVIAKLQLFSKNKQQISIAYSYTVVFDAEIDGYCTGNPTSVTNAITPTILNSTVNSITYYTCTNGYTSSLGSPPYLKCNALSSTSGSYSLQYSASCTSSMEFIHNRLNRLGLKGRSC